MHGGPRKGAGRRKQERPTNMAVASAVLAKVKAEEKWIRIIEISSEKAEKTGNTADLARALIYLDNRAYGDPHVTVNHLHDKPLDVNLSGTLSIANELREARERAAKK